MLLMLIMSSTGAGALWVIRRIVVGAEFRSSCMCPYVLHGAPLLLLLHKTTTVVN